ncbi:chaperone protein DnaJ isoform X5 [Manihot esculenta]|uniref:chaperone protein DnaJ isoform X5 n=1 Tax=Manihot esculenta TaxID=3983 RepID=UPI001CC6258B|nr:chaperone protein DnaJ isoform X5 [Manihot esculenta]
MWDDWGDCHQDQNQDQDQDSHFNFDFLSLVSKPKDYYKILEVDYDASDDAIRSNYIRLALKWHPDKHKNQDSATSIFQDINEAYQGKTIGQKGSSEKKGSYLQHSFIWLTKTRR